MQTFLEQLGGREKLQEIIDVFIDRVVADTMIGFFFRKVNIDRLKEMEYQLAAQFFGGDERYNGRPLRAAHQKHPIMGGHFARRKQILSDVLNEFDIDQKVKDAWLEHTENLRSSITQDQGSACQHRTQKQAPWEN